MSKIKITKEQVDFIFSWSDMRTDCYHQGFNWIFDDDDYYKEYNAGVDEYGSLIPGYWLPHDHIKSWMWDAVEHWNRGLREVPDLPSGDTTYSNCTLYKDCPMCDGDGELESGGWCAICQGEGRTLKPKNEIKQYVNKWIQLKSQGYKKEIV